MIKICAFVISTGAPLLSCESKKGSEAEKSIKKQISRLKCKVPKVTRKCHPEVKPKDLANKKEILHFAARSLPSSEAKGSE